MATHLNVKLENEPLPAPGEFAAEWAKERVQQSGPGAELLRRVYAEHVRGFVDSYLEAATALDVMALYEVFRMGENHRGPESEGQCSVVEQFCAMLGLEPETLLTSNVQRRPRI